MLCASEFRASVVQLQNVVAGEMAVVVLEGGVVGGIGDAADGVAALAVADVVVDVVVDVVDVVNVVIVVVDVVVGIFFRDDVKVAGRIFIAAVIVFTFSAVFTADTVIIRDQGFVDVLDHANWNIASMCCVPSSELLSVQLLLALLLFGVVHGDVLGRVVLLIEKTLELLVAEEVAVTAVDPLLLHIRGTALQASHVSLLHVVRHRSDGEKGGGKGSRRRSHLSGTEPAHQEEHHTDTNIGEGHAHPDVFREGLHERQHTGVCY